MTSKESNSNGTERINVTNASLKLPAIALVRPRPVYGQVVIESGSAFIDEGKPTDLSVINIELQPKDRLVRVAEQLRVRVQGDNTFCVPRVISGDEYWVNVTNVPKPLYVKRVEVVGRDVYGEPFVSGQGDLKLILGGDGATLTGIVTDGTKTVEGAKILLLYSSAASAPAPNQLVTTLTDANGRFRLTPWHPPTI